MLLSSICPACWQFLRCSEQLRSERCGWVRCFTSWLGSRQKCLQQAFACDLDSNGLTLDWVCQSYWLAEQHLLSGL